MEVWLSFRNNEDRFQLPVTPSSYGVTRGKDNKKVNINSLGDIKLIGKEGLRSLTIESFFPAHDYSFIDSAERWDPFEYIEMIEKWEETTEPIRVIYTDTLINYAMAIESFTWGEEDGTGDIYFTLSLEEYIFVKKTKTKVKQSKRTTQKKKSNSIYKTKEGDTLYKIAKKEYGKGEQWKKIYNHGNNKKVIGKNPNILRVGLDIVIPK